MNAQAHTSREMLDEIDVEPDLDEDTMLVMMAQAAACLHSERETAESIARVRARLMREFGVT